MPFDRVTLSGRNDQLLPGFDLIRIVQLVSLSDLHVLAGVTIKVFADFRQAVSRLHGVGLIGLPKFDIVLEISELGIHSFDRIPNPILASLRRGGGFQIQLISIEVEVL